MPPDVLIEAFCRLASKRGDVALLVLGDGHLRHELEQTVRVQGVPVNRNLSQELQFMRDELNITGYEDYF